MTKEEAINTIITWQSCMEKTYNKNDFAKEYIQAAEVLVKYIIEKES